MAAIDWRQILEREVANHPRGRAGVAEALGVSRAYVSRVLSEGKSHVPPSRRFLARVEAVYGRIRCPHRGEEIARSECYRALQPAPVHNPALIHQWRACQRCPLKPKGGES